MYTWALVAYEGMENIYYLCGFKLRNGHCFESYLSPKVKMLYLGDHIPAQLFPLINIEKSIYAKYRLS